MSWTLVDEIADDKRLDPTQRLLKIKQISREAKAANSERAKKCYAKRKQIKRR